MRLSDKDCETIERLSHFAAKQHFLKYNPASTEEQAEQFAARHWRQFEQVGIDIFAVWTALDEAEAAAGN